MQILLCFVYTRHVCTNITEFAAAGRRFQREANSCLSCSVVDFVLCVCTLDGFSGDRHAELMSLIMLGARCLVV